MKPALRATALALAAPALALTLASCSTSPTATPRQPTGSITDDATTHCVTAYTPSAVAGLGFAFDGTVVKLGTSVSDRGDEGDLDLTGATFEVNEWFHGGHRDRVTVDLPLGTDDSVDIGTRLLVSGQPRWGGEPLDSPIAWGCGFSRYHDKATATAWREAVAEWDR